MRPAALIAAMLALLAACSTPPPEPPVRLTATLVSPTDITLEWRGQEPDVAGQVIEFATEPQGRYTILEFVPPERTTFTHPDLMPRTPFYYRIRPYDGPVETPTTAEHADTVDLTWTDRTADEDGYLIELKPLGTPDFRVVALVDPNVTSYQLITMPEERQATYRVRAFRFGQPSNVVSRTTGNQPS